jgi:hypothetical protein
MTPTSSVDAAAASEPLAPDNAAVLVELAGSIESVRPNRSRWTTLTIAAFAGLTCLGLASTSFFPRVTDRASERRDATTASAKALSPLGGPRPATPAHASPAARPASPASPALPPVDPVVATWRVMDDHGDQRLFVSGAATPIVHEITVTVAGRGRPIATAEVPVIDDGGGRDDLIPWSTVVDLPTLAKEPDGVATVTISWVGARTTDGSLVSLLVLGDGRGRPNGR